MESNKDSNSQAPEIKMEKGSELTKEPAPVLATEKVEATQVQNNTVVVEKKGGLGCFGKGCIAGCVILLLCCCVTVILGVVAPSIIAQVIASSSKGQDSTLTRITADEIPALNKAALDNLPEILDAEGKMMAFTYTEEQFLASMIEGLQAQDKSGSIGIDFEENVGKIEIEMSLLVEAMKSDPTVSEQVNLKPEDVKGVYITLQLSNDSEGNLVFDQLSLGNSALDPILNSFFTPELKKELTQSIQDGLSGATSDTTDTTEDTTEEPQTVLRKVEFKKDAVKLTFENSGIVYDQIEESDL